MSYILNKNRQGAPLQIPLAGAAIGNGWFDPAHQYSAAEAAYGHGLLDRAQVNAMAVKEQACQTELAQGNYDADVCFALQDDVIDESFGTSSKFRVSSYDVRLSENKKGDRRFPKGHKVTEGYLGGWDLPNWAEGTLDTSVWNDVLEIIHATAATEAGLTYCECTDPPYDALADEDGKSVVTEIASVLQDPSRPALVFFTGVEDLICNHVGTEKALENIPWDGRDTWLNALRSAWLPFPNRPQAAGFVKEFETLIFVKILNAGHMVPMDVPEIALELIRTLLFKGGNYASSQQKLTEKADKPPSSCTACEICPAPPRLHCPTCDFLDDTPSRECAAAVQKALSSGGNAVGSNPSTAIGALILVAGLIVYACVIARQQNNSHHAMEAVEDHVELQPPRYRDESEL
uniref:Carboxypeptidase n=1 Tax=Entomoneis paludosa TaxID=265537 RepID=A0A7S3DMQ3_9STRA